MSEVIDALDGSTAVARLLSTELHRRYSQSRVSNWKSTGQCPEQETYPVLAQALDGIGCIADPRLWNLGPQHVDHARTMAIGLETFFRRGGRHARRLGRNARRRDVGRSQPTEQLAMIV